MGVSAVTEKDVMREGEGEKGKRRMSLEQHVGCLDSKKQWRRDSTGDDPPTHCFGIRPVTPR